MNNKESKKLICEKYLLFDLVVFMRSGSELYSVRKSYWIYYHGFRTRKSMLKAKKDHILSQKFIERIMLAVTEVNRCKLCKSYHSKKALQTGICPAEIDHILSGVLNDSPADEVEALKFAHDYAVRRGNPTRESWKRMINLYGTSKAKGILGAIGMIMIGNTIGIPWVSFKNRLRGKPDPRCSISYEIRMFFGYILIPIAYIHASISNYNKKPLINFQ